ncbi:MAG: hypothetical protein JXA78_11115, partial [Anaerolineales bacterium]|nr:hypothetical protein [Anaerolineales bacterium]
CYQTLTRSRRLSYGKSLNRWLDGRLLFNPGSPHFLKKKELAPSLGLLHISAEGEVRGEIVNLGDDRSC